MAETASDNRKEPATAPMAEKVPLVVLNGGNKVDDDNKSDNGRDRDAVPDGGSEIPDNERPDLNSFYPGRLSPYSPSVRGDLETGRFLANGEPIPDVNVYQQKKTLAQGMMDLALFSANANQLRYVLESSGQHPYYYPSIGFIAISLIFQVAVGVGLTWNATYNVKDEKEICIANKISNFTIIGVFIITVVNVFISAFGVANPAAAV